MKWGPGSVSKYHLLPLWQQKFYDQQKYWIGYSYLSSPTPRPMIKQNELLRQILGVLNPPFLPEI